MSNTLNPVATLAIGQWRVVDAGQVLHAQWETGGILILHHTHRQMTLLCHIAASPKLTHEISQTLALVRQASWWDGQPGTWSAKIIGETTFTDGMRQGLKDLGITNEKTTLKAGAHEFYLYGDDARLRLAPLPANPTSPSVQASVRQAPETKAHRPLTVLIVDDSASIRKILSGIFQKDPDFGKIITAERPSEVEALITAHRPDVITLDVHMPEMDGVSLLKLLLPRHPIPVVMITSVAMEDGPMVLDALDSGAVDYIQKPSFSSLGTAAPLIAEKVKAAAHARVVTRHSEDQHHALRRPQRVSLDQDCLVVIGSSTGGTEALKQVLTRLPETIPPILCVQHIPPVFSAAFAKRLNELCPFAVKEAGNGDEVQAGRVLIAPGGLQMRVIRHGKQLKVALEDSPPVNRHKPSVDFMFNSVVELGLPHVIGIILTGMGADGARGLLALREKGAFTIAQDEESCVVYGMPREAVRMGAACEELPLLKIPELMIRHFQKKMAS